MPKPDMYDAPSYSSEDTMLEEPTIGDRLGTIGSAVKKRKGIIIGIIIIAIIGFFAYDFFIGSYRTIDFLLENTEGELLYADVFKIFDSSGNKIFDTSGESNFSVKLKLGEYRIEARTSPEYEAINTSITVSENAEQKIEFEKNIKANITGFAENFPKTLVAGQAAEFDISVENRGSEAQEIEFVPSASLEELNIQIPKILVAGNNAETTTVTINVPASISIADAKEGDDLKGYIRVKYTNTKANVPSGAKLFPKPVLDLSPSSFTISGNAGESKTKNFKIENESEFAIEKITLGFEITSILNNSESDILSGIEFVQGTQINSIPGKKTRQNEYENTLKFNIPITAKKEKINANIIIESQMLPEPVKLPVVLDIQKGADFGLSVSASSKNPSIKYEKANGRFEIKPAYIRLDNTGSIDLENIYVQTKNSNECTSSWLRFRESSAAQLKAGQETQLLIEISAPLSAIDEEKMLCQIRYWYDNPITPGEKIDGTIEQWIEITANK